MGIGWIGKIRALVLREIDGCKGCAIASQICINNHEQPFDDEPKTLGYPRKHSLPGT